ncbi:right-handed parallel beta-helix repeat-containing protein [bacterium]|nr:right-handed parallel beta-helix repeat-containing protein [bacterium]
MQRSLVVVLTVLVMFGTWQAGAAIITMPGGAPTIQQAVESAAPGDTILLGKGIYQQLIRVDNKPLTIASYFLTTGDSSAIRSTILHGGGITNDAAIVTTTGSDTLTLVGLTLTASSDGIQPFSPLNVRHCVIYGTVDGIDYESGSGGFLTDCLIERNVDDAVDLDEDTQVIIERCILRDNDDDGIEIRLHPWAWDSLRVVIRDNTITGNGEDGIQFIGYNEDTHRHFRIENNLIADNEMSAIACMDDSTTREDYRGAQIPERIDVIGNTFVNNPYCIVGGAKFRVKDNLFIGSSAAVFRRVGDGAMLAGNTAWECRMLAEEMGGVRHGFRRIIPRSEGRPGEQWPVNPGVEGTKRMRWMPAAPAKAQNDE